VNTVDGEVDSVRGFTCWLFCWVPFWGALELPETAGIETDEEMGAFTPIVFPET
jgi:hypothetical protein